MDEATIEAAVRLLGQPANEIASADKTADGFVVVTVRSGTYIDVPADKPDADGKFGLMYLVAPCDPYTGSFPVFAVGEDAVVVEVAPDVEPETPAEAAAEPEKSVVPVKKATRARKAAAK